MMVLRDTLVYDFENWSTYQPFPVVSLFLCLGPSFIEAVIVDKVDPFLVEGSVLYHICGTRNVVSLRQIKFIKRQKSLESLKHLLNLSMKPQMVVSVHLYTYH